MAEALRAAGLAAPLGEAAPPSHPPLDETARVAEAIRARGLL
jgi:mitochondrial fission protein ELM1